MNVHTICSISFSIVIEFIGASLRNQNETGAALDDFIVGGFAVDISRVPYQVNLRYRRDSICGASIISARHCLTAAHCYERGTLHRHYNVIVGATAVSGRDRGAFNSEVQRFIVHPLYREQRTIHDVAVLVLLNPLPLNRATIVAIAMPAVNTPVPFGREGLVSGW